MLPEFRRESNLLQTIFTPAVAAAVFWLGFDSGTYGLQARSTVAIAVWWAVVMGVALGLWPLARVPRVALVAGALLAAFTVLTGISMIWAESAERAFTEFNRAALYLGVFAFAVLAGTRANIGRWCNGMAIGVTAVGIVALASRFFPAVFPAGDVPAFLPATYTRLSYPVEYWNGLAIFLGLGFPLLLRAALSARTPVLRGLALAPLPALAAVVYLASSRGGFAVIIVAAIAFLVLTTRRWAAAAAILVALAGAAAAIAVLVANPDIVNGPFETAAAEAAGRRAALLVTLICAVVAAAYVLGSRFIPGRLELRPLVGRVATALVVLAALAGIAAADPLERFETFKEPPSALQHPQRDFVKAHLLSGNGSGRWQFWGAAIDEWKSAPLLGRGAGSYEAWWAQHGTIATFVRDAHSLYLETLGELGLFGLAVLVGALGAAAFATAPRIFRRNADRVTVAALSAAFVGFLVGAGIDWMWELTAVSVIEILCLGFLTGPATAVPPRPRVTQRDERPRRSRRHFALGVAALATGWLLICAQAIPLLTQIKIGDSQAAVERRDAEKALDDALAARALQPWAASPYLQLALVEEQTGDLASAREWIGEAIERDALDWRLWLVRTRLETKAGAVDDARRSLRRAAELNPRSPLFASVAR